MTANYAFTEEDRFQPVYCTQCRAHIPRAVSNSGKGVCPGCRRSALLSARPQAPAAPAQVDPTAPPRTCPRCATDQIVKVSGIVAGQTWHSASVGQVALVGSDGGVAVGAGGSQGVKASVLAQRLAAPTEPRVAFHTLEFLLALFSVGIALWARELSDNENMHYVVLGGIISWFVFRTGYQLVRVSTDTPEWRRRSEQWDRLYYCVRCDAVFDPVGGRSVPAGRMADIFAP